MTEKLTKKNLLLNWKHSKIIECDDEKFDNGEWIRTAILEFNSKFYYVCIMNGIVKKVVPIEYMPYSYYNGKIDETNTDTKIKLTLNEIVENLE